MTTINFLLAGAFRRMAAQRVSSNGTQAASALRASVGPVLRPAVLFGAMVITG